MKVDLRGQHDVGQIVGFAYRIYARSFAALFAIALVTVPLELLTNVLQRRVPDGAQSAVSLLAVPAALVTLIAVAALIVAVHDITGGTKPEAARSLDVAIARFPGVITTALLVAVLAVAALAAVPFLTLWWVFRRDATIDGQRNWWLVLIPGALTVYLSVRWVLSTQVLMLEGPERWAAMDGSADAVRGSWWRTLGILIVIVLVQLGPLVIASAGAYAPVLIGATITSVIGAFVLPFAVAAQTLLYYDLKARRHDIRPDRFAAPEQDPG